MEVVYEKYTTEIFYELACMPEFLVYTQEEREKKCPTFALITDKEFREMCSFLKGELLRFLNSEFFAEIEIIEERAFAECSKIKGVDLSNIKSLGDYVFENCANLSYIALGTELKEIPEGLCSGCLKLSIISTNVGLERIGKYAFAKTQLKFLTIPEKLTYIDSMIFKDCRTSVQVIIPFKKYNMENWARDWNQGFAITHKFMKFLNPQVKIKARR